MRERPNSNRCQNRNPPAVPKPRPIPESEERSRRLRRENPDLHRQSLPPSLSGASWMGGD
jgi:hypothetical protein